jgi:periodic tryptophan protein 2
MSTAYRLNNVCGSVYKSGNLIFSPDGKKVISPVGNRITVTDLVA